TAAKKPSHPPTSEMVDNAIRNLKERGGSSLVAIKRYVAASYKVDAERLSPFIKKYLKAAVVGRTLVQTNGKGATEPVKIASIKEEKSTVAVAPRKATTTTTTTTAKKGTSLTKRKKAASPTSPGKPIAKKTNKTTTTTTSKKKKKDRS